MATAVVSCNVHYDCLSEWCSQMWSATGSLVSVVSGSVHHEGLCYSSRLVAIDVASHCGHCRGHSCGQLKGVRAQSHCFAWARSPWLWRSWLVTLQSPADAGEKLGSVSADWLTTNNFFGDSKCKNVNNVVISFFFLQLYKT